MPIKLTDGNQQSNQLVRSNGQYKISDLIDNTACTRLQGRKIAVVSGAGIAGLAAALELSINDYDVTVVEKRGSFSRPNFIGLNKEVQEFLRKFGWLEEFEASVVTRIQDHKIVFIKDGVSQLINTSSVSDLQFEGELSTDPAQLNDHFQENGIYSTQIKDIQAFLTKKAASLGVRILSESEVKIVESMEERHVSVIEITPNDHTLPTTRVEPDLFFIAEGANSASVQKFGMADEEKDVVHNACTDEKWFFGNLHYHGDSTFVTSMIISSKKTTQIANAIFNAKKQTVNVAVTSDESLSKDDIHQLIFDTAQKAFTYEGISEKPEIIEVVAQPVRITNRIASCCSSANVFRLGDSIGHSSPLAGLGGTLALSLTPRIVAKLIDDVQNRPGEAHGNFEASAQAYAQRWIGKALLIKNKILTIAQG